jgi:REP element-mobilizing transposase RayT
VQISVEPLAYFITWTVYGAYLQGDSRGWRKAGKGIQSPQPLLELWHRNRLQHEVILLSKWHRESVASQVMRHCQHRGWRLWVANPRTNHVHVVVTAPGYAGNKVRDELKANCTRGLSEMDEQFVDRPVWSAGGDWQCLSSEADLEQAILYAGEAQDRMEYK